MRPSRLLPSGLLLAALLAAGRAPAPAHAATATESGRRGGMIINDVPDTGQFLPDSVWLARVGPRIVRVKDFIDRWFAAYPPDRPAPDSAGRVQFLKGMVQGNVMGLTAVALNRPLGFEDRATLRDARERALSNAVFRKLVQDSVHVTDADVHALWLQLGYTQHFRHILFDDRPTAERVRRELLLGRMSWSVAVQRYTRAANDSGPNGNLGWVTRDALAPALAQEIYGLKPGELSAVVADRQGYHIVQSVERRPKTPPDFNALKDLLRSQLESLAAQQRAEAIQAVLRTEKGLTYDTTNAAFAATRFHTTVRFEQQGLTPSYQINDEPPDFSPADTSRVLARWSGGRFTIGDLLIAFNELPPVMRPNLNLPEAVMSQVDAIVLEPDMAEFAVRKGFDKDPGVIAEIEKKREELLVGHLYQDSIASHVSVSREERRAYYDQHPKDFTSYPEVRYAAIIRHHKASAESLVAALKSGADPAAILRADSLAGETTGSIATKNQNENNPYKKILFEELRPGQATLAGPDRVGDYIVFKVLSYDPGHKVPYADVETAIDESLQNIKSEKALNAMIDRMSKRYAVAWRPELVARIRLVDPSLGPD